MTGGATQEFGIGISSCPRLQAHERTENVLEN